MFLDIYCYIYPDNFLLHYILHHLVSGAWWDWLLTWLTNHNPSVLCHCCLGHRFHKIVPEMTYNVSGWTFNPMAIKPHTTVYLYLQQTSNIRRRLEDRTLNQARSKPNPVHRPVRTAHTIVHHYNSIQYYSTEVNIPPFLHISDVAKWR